MLVRYRGLIDRRIVRHMYPLAGITYRRVGNIATSLETVNADSSTDYSEKQAAVSRSNQIGFTAGIGYRFVDELGIKILPEIRFTRWMNHTFEGLSYSSSANQAQVGIGITF